MGSLVKGANSGEKGIEKEKKKEIEKEKEKEEEHHDEVNMNIL